MAEQEPKPGSLDEALWHAFAAGMGEGGDYALDAFWTWRRSTLGSRLDGPLPQADEPMPFPWDDRR